MDSKLFSFWRKVQWRRKERKSDSQKSPQQVCVMVRMSKRLCWVSLSVIGVQRRKREADSEMKEEEEAGYVKKWWTEDGRMKKSGAVRREKRNVNASHAWSREKTRRRNKGKDGSVKRSPRARGLPSPHWPNSPFSIRPLLTATLFLAPSITNSLKA